MRRVVINSVLILLSAISILFITFCLTLLNNKFVLNQFNTKNYYNEIIINVKNKDIHPNEIKANINKYIKSNYNIKSIDNYEYAKEIAFFEKNFMSIKIASYMITIILIIITGNIFLKTKKNHNINFIMMISSFIGIIISGVIYIFFEYENPIVNNLIHDANYYLLALNIIILDFLLLKKIKTRFM